MLLESSLTTLAKNLKDQKACKDAGSVTREEERRTVRKSQVKPQQTAYPTWYPTHQGGREAAIFLTPATGSSSWQNPKLSKSTEKADRWFRVFCQANTSEIMDKSQQHQSDESTVTSPPAASASPYIYLGTLRQPNSQTTFLDTLTPTRNIPEQLKNIPVERQNWEQGFRQYCTAFAAEWRGEMSEERKGDPDK